MMIKYDIKVTSKFRKDYKKIKKQGKDIKKFEKLLEYLVSGEEIPLTYKDHQLINTKEYKNCRECHIEPDWLLVYQKNNDELILLLVNTGSHSELFGK